MSLHFFLAARTFIDCARCTVLMPTVRTFVVNNLGFTLKSVVLVGIIHRGLDWWKTDLIVLPGERALLELIVVSEDEFRRLCTFKFLLFGINWLLGRLHFCSWINSGECDCRFLLASSFEWDRFFKRNSGH